MSRNQTTTSRNEPTPKFGVLHTQTLEVKTKEAKCVKLAEDAPKNVFLKVFLKSQHQNQEANNPFKTFLSTGANLMDFRFILPKSKPEPDTGNGKMSNNRASDSDSERNHNQHFHMNRQSGGNMPIGFPTQEPDTEKLEVTDTIKSPNKNGAILDEDADVTMTTATTVGNLENPQSSQNAPNSWSTLNPSTNTRTRTKRWCTIRRQSDKESRSVSLRQPQQVEERERRTPFFIEGILGQKSGNRYSHHHHQNRNQNHNQQQQRIDKRKGREGKLKEKSSPGSLMMMKLKNRNQGSLGNSFSCPEAHCRMKSSYKGNMLKHHRVIHRLRPWKCSVLECQRTFSQKHDMERHADAVTHLSERGARKDKVEGKVKCSFCQKYYSNKSNLRTHLRLHNGEGKQKKRLKF